MTEADILKSISHENIVKVQHFFLPKEDQTTMYIILEYCEGGNLHDEL